jgi:3'-5' exoribonuclease
MMKTTYVSNLKAGNEVTEEQFAVKSIKTGGITRDGKPYYDLELTDKTGAIKAKVWSDSIPFCESASEGDIVEINAKVKNGFNGNPELSITKMSKTNNYELGDFVPKSSFDVDKMKKEFLEVIKQIKNEHLAKLVDNIFDDAFTEAFVNSPAAYTVHHDYEGGLVEHTLEMLRLIPAIKESFPKINKDLLTVGVILHDIGKVREFEQKTTITFTTEGKLLGHIFIGAEYIKSKMPKDFPKDLQDEVLHMILAHHGEYEYGSPVKPSTAEAVALNTLDLVSSRINMAYYTVHNPDEKNLFSKYHKQLGVEFYRSPFLEEPEENIPF